MTKTQNDTAQLTKVLELGNGLSIWRAHVDALREMDRNARVMAPDRFERLVANIKRDGRLESLPLCAKSAKRDNELQVISGHHRLRAARKAGILIVVVLVIETDLTLDQIKARQLAHNSLAGEDDQQVLKEIYDSIQDLEERISTGILESELAAELDQIKADDLGLELDYELVNLMFLPEQQDEFDRACAAILADKKVLVSEMRNFEPFKAAIQRVAHVDDVRNVSTIIARMAQIVIDYYEGRPSIPAIGTAPAPVPGKAPAKRNRKEREVHPGSD